MKTRRHANFKRGLNLFLSLLYGLSLLVVDPASRPVVAQASPVLDATNPFAEQNSQVVIEAEHFSGNISRNGQSWVARTDPAGYAGDAVMLADPNTGSNINDGYTTSSPELQYAIQFNTPGTYFVWLRARVDNDFDNSAHVGLNGQVVNSADRMVLNNFGAWEWTSVTMDGPPASLNIPGPGLYTLNVWMREDGFRLDRVLLTTDSRFIPSDRGPSESPHGPSGGSSSDTFPYTDVIAFCGIDNFAWTIGNALARSAQPGSGEAFECLRAAGFTTIIKQNTDDTFWASGIERQAVEELGMEFIDAYGLPDQTAYEPGQFEAMMQDVVGRLKAGERILVHDAGGRGRMGFWEAAFMMWDGWSSREAIDRYIAFGWKIDCGKGGNGQMQGINEIAAALGQPRYYPAQDSYGTPWNDCPRPSYMDGWDYAAIQWPEGQGGQWSVTGVIPGRGPNPTPTQAPTNTSVPPTNTWTPLPPTATSAPPTATFIPSNTPTATRMMPTATRTPTATRISPTATRTFTATRVPPTATRIQPTATWTASPGFTSNNPFLEQDGQVVIEAENPSANLSRGGQSWVLRTSPAGYLGNGIMAAEPNSGTVLNAGYTTGSPELQYLIQFSTTGTYYVWLRAQADTASDNSVHVGLDGHASTSADRLSLSNLGSWTWGQSTQDGAVATLTVASPGLHTLNVWMREDGFRLDRLLLTTRSKYTPNGTGPTESLRGENDGTPMPTDIMTPTPKTTSTRTPTATAIGASSGPDRLKCTGYPEPRIFLESQAWWITTPGQSGTDHGHVHVGTCFPYMQTLSGVVEFDVRVILHNNPGRLYRLMIQAKHPRLIAGAYPVLLNLKTDFTCPTTCETWYHVALDTRILENDGRMEFRFRPHILQPDGQHMRASSGWDAIVKNGKPVDNYPPAGPFTEARGWYTDAGYTNARLNSPLPLTPVSGIVNFDVALIPGVDGLPVTHHTVTLDPNFHAVPVVPGIVLKDGLGEFRGVISIDTRQLTNGAHRLVLRAEADNPRGSTNGGVLVVPFTVNNPVPSTSSPTPTQTRTPLGTPTKTAAPPTVTRTPTQTNAPPMATPTQAATAKPALGSITLPSVDPTSLGTCSAAIHDQYMVIGPDGKPYRTWHPAHDLVNGCTFAHEHGDDPRTSLANSSLPPFGYIGTLAGDNEPHEGFKVFVANRGVVNGEGRVAKTSTRIVAHMGTGGPKRFSTARHSFMFDLVAPDGHYAHVQGMADTGGVGSICAKPREGKTVVIVKGLGCDLESLYEIWAFTLNIGDKLTVIASTAVFDPITLFNPANPTQLLLTSTSYPGDYHGCNREAYFGPVYWRNASGPTVYQTNAYGNLMAGGPLRQEISAHNANGIAMSPDQTQFKLHTSQCVPGLGLKN
jgi:hypothetical protein